MIEALDIETRTFEQRFGARCFCGETWGSYKRCGEPADRTIEQSLAMLFADRKAAQCVTCDKDIPANRKHCWDCAANIARHRNGQDRHRRVTGICNWCQFLFEHRSDKRPDTCGYRCMNLKRQAGRRAASAG